MAWNPFKKSSWTHLGKTIKTYYQITKVLDPEALSDPTGVVRGGKATIKFYKSDDTGVIKAKGITKGTKKTHIGKPDD